MHSVSSIRGWIGFSDLSKLSTDCVSVYTQAQRNNIYSQ